MYTNLGTILRNPIGPNSSQLDIITSPIDSISYSIDAIKSSWSGLFEPDIKATLPSPIVASQGAPANVDQMTIAGSFTPEIAASSGLANEQSANSSMLSSYLDNVNSTPSYSGLIVLGILIIGGIMLLGVAKK